MRHAAEVAEVADNVAMICRYYGISQPTFYSWLRRYEEFGEQGLRDRSSRPKHCPYETDPEVVGKIIHLCQNYHFGPAKISMYLKRYRDIKISNSGVWRILKLLDMNRLPASQKHKAHDKRWKRYEKQQPGFRAPTGIESALSERPFASPDLAN